MNTPIRDFVKKYSESDYIRLHMPGHKGKGLMGVEEFDITEISGADVLYSADGIIKESEENASSLFGTYKTFYSAEGSSLCIKAMLGLIVSCRKDKSENTRILAARNVHKAFVYACGLLDIDVDWLYGKTDHLCTCYISADDIKEYIKNTDKIPDAVYVTSPDYLGNILDIRSIADVCDENEIPLIVDNAHGAYLHFLAEKAHPIDEGASMCADSAHKTLPVLTGGAYLHISEKAAHYADYAENMLSLFASTSPSYLILQSLDICNSYLSDSYTERLERTVARINQLKDELTKKGFFVLKSEPLKLVVDIKQSGITSEDILKSLKKHKIEAEFFDGEVLVMMFSCENAENDYIRVSEAFSALTTQVTSSDSETPYFALNNEKAISIREALFSAKEIVSTEDAVGRICACPTVSCPPAVPVVISGEIINEDAAEIMKKYNINTIEVVK